MAVRFQFRRGTSTEWAQHNPILLEGEVGIEKNTKKIKIGDGLSNWNTLTYMNQGQPGEAGEGLDFKWEGTKLGIKSKSDVVYHYVDLQSGSELVLEVEDARHGEETLSENLENMKIRTTTIENNISNYKSTMWISEGIEPPIDGKFWLDTSIK